MIGVFVSGRYDGAALDVGDPPPASKRFESIGQLGPPESMSILYRLAQVLEQPLGQPFAIYRSIEDETEEPSEFEALIAECRAREWGYSISVDPAAPGDTIMLRIVASGSSLDDPMPCANIHLGSRELLDQRHRWRQTSV